MIQSETWGIVREFKTVPDFIKCNVVQNATKYPAGAEVMEKKIWDEAVKLKKEDLKRKDPNLELRLTVENERESLWGRYEHNSDFTPIMVPGHQYRFVDFHADGSVLDVERVIYSEIEALKSKEYRNLFGSSGLPLPDGPLAPVLYIATMDGYIAATVRGEGTNKYPGAIWGVGGDIDDPTLTIGEHVTMSEAKEELSRSGGLSQQSHTLGIVFDRVLRKHDMPILTTYGAIFRGIKKGKKYLADVETITPISLREEELADYIMQNHIDSTDPSDMRWVGRPTPPCIGGLFLIGKHLYGDAWSEKVMNEIS